MTLATDLFLLLVGAGALWYGAERFVEGAVGLARRANISELVVGVVVVGIGTSMPEVVASSAAALGGRTDLAVGNAVGSNLVNLGVVLGAVAFVTPLRARRFILLLFVLVSVPIFIGAVAFINRSTSKVDEDEVEELKQRVEELESEQN
ncbi:MAG: hypothetical protein U5K28_06150 [Halobacteriales archaeon]|nr:hypothetical protein [Halobacteriales archaeon]